VARRPLARRRERGERLAREVGLDVEPHVGHGLVAREPVLGARARNDRADPDVERLLVRGRLGDDERFLLVEDAGDDVHARPAAPGARPVAMWKSVAPSE